MGGGQIFCFIKNFVEFYCKAKKLSGQDRTAAERKKKSIFDKISQMKQLFLVEKWKFFH